ncbi:MAG: hypothetical protein ACRCV6_01655 [Formosimonas sp.]
MKFTWMVSLVGLGVLSNCAVVDEVKLVQRAYQLPSGATSTARLRVNTDALAFVYPRGCADSSAEGSGVVVFKNNSDRLGTTKGNNQTLGMPMGLEEFNDPRFGHSEVRVPADQFITLGYRYDNRSTSLKTTCQGDWAFVAKAGRDYEAALFSDDQRNQCIAAVRDMATNQLIHLTNVTHKSCTTLTTTTTTQVELSKENTHLIIGIANEQGQPNQKSTQIPRDAKIFAHVVLNWDNIGSNDQAIISNVSKTFHSKWYNTQGALIQDMTTHMTLNTPGAWFATWMNSSSVGIGTGRVEIYEGDKLLAKSKFEVVDVPKSEFKVQKP